MAELTLKDVFIIISRRIWLVVLLPLIAVIAAAALVFFVLTPLYTASTSMYVLNKQSVDNMINYTDLQSSALLTADYRELILSRRVLSAVALQFGIDVETMREDYHIEVTSANNTRIIVVSATAADPVLAANLSNAIGREFSSTVVEIMDANNVNFVDIAEPPIEPSAPQKALVIAITGVAVLMLAVGIALLIEILNTTLRTTEDVENALSLPVLACVPKIEVK